MNLHNIAEHITEYQKQIEEHQRAIIALTGAIQALERLQKEEAESGDEQDSTQG